MKPFKELTSLGSFPLIQIKIAFLIFSIKGQKRSDVLIGIISRGTLNLFLICLEFILFILSVGCTEETFSEREKLSVFDPGKISVP